MENEYLKILDEENKAILKVLECEEKFRKSVKEKNWNEMTTFSSEMNDLLDFFNSLDERRESLSKEKKGFSEHEKNLLLEIKEKLLRARIESRAIGEYIKLNRDFIERTVLEALPQSKNRLYSKKGFVVQKPESVVLNTLS